MNEITASILVIGNEILSGSTQDINVAFIAQRLVKRGIKLCEVRVVRDEPEAIVGAVNALRRAYKYVFTTGGIGPTHDDITSECMAQAFGVAWEIHPEARRRLEEYYRSRDTEMNEARLRMAKIPHGATLIDNPVSIAPGYKMENVFVMAGVPKIMQAMFDHVEGMLEQGRPMLSETVSAAVREADIAKGLEDIQREFPDLEIGSYPQMGIGTNLVLRGTDETRLQAAVEKVRKIVEK